MIFVEKTLIISREEKGDALKSRHELDSYPCFNWIHF